MEFECAAVLHGHTQDVKAVYFHPHDDTLLSVSYDDTIKVWRDDEGGDWHCADTLTAHRSTVWGAAFDASGNRFVSASDDGCIAVWTLSPAAAPGGDPKYRLSCTLSGYHRRTVYSVDWCHVTGRIVSGGADDSIRVFVDVSDGGAARGADAAPGVTFEQEAVAAAAHRGDVNCVRWSPRMSGLLASAGDDGVVRLWQYSSPV